MTKERKKVEATYIGPGARFPDQGDVATGDTVKVWADEVAARWDLEKKITPKPKP